MMIEAFAANWQVAQANRFYGSAAGFLEVPCAMVPCGLRETLQRDTSGAAGCKDYD